MKKILKRPSNALLSSAGAIALMLAVTAPVTSAYAGGSSEDCTGTCPSPEMSAVMTPGPDGEPGSGSEGSPGGAPEGDNESSTGTENETTGNT